MPVSTAHPDYESSLSKWELVRDCVSGAKAVKTKTTVYLPDPGNRDEIHYISDPSDRNRWHSRLTKRYYDYIFRAQFVNVAAKTRNAMVGMAFRNPAQVELPSGLEYLELNATGEGRSLEQLGKDTVGDLLEVGRFGLLSDYPTAEEGLTQAQVNAMNLQANIKTYPAENIINWKTDTVGGEEILSLVVLTEKYNIAEDEYSHDSETQYRVLKLTEGAYTVEIWRDDEIYAVYQPRNGSGQLIDRIPFVMVGTYNNNPAVDDAALYDIAEVNIGHYRNTADYEEGIFLHGQPMLHLDLGDTNTNTFQDLNPNGVEVGSRRGLITSGGGSAQLLQPQANSAAVEAMEQKLAYMLALGASLIQPSGQAETAEAARIKHAGDNSVLTNIVQNASEAIKQAIEWCAEFMNVQGDIVYQINEDFYDKSLTAQDVMADIQLYDRGVIGKTDMRLSLRKSGRLERSDDDIDAEVGDVSPIG